jgi:hypothetical protein
MHFLFIATILAGIAQAQHLRAFPGDVALDTVYNITISSKGPRLTVHAQVFQSGQSYGRPTHYIIELRQRAGVPPFQTIRDSAYLLPTFYLTSHRFRDEDLSPDDPDFEPAVSSAVANNEFVQFVDMNFDGYMDLRLLHDEAPLGGFSYNYWLFDPLSSTYSLDSLLSYHCSYPALDRKLKIIASMSTGGWDKLQFRGGKPLVIEHNEKELVAINGRMRYRYTKFQLIDGQMKATKVTYADH